MRWPAEQHAFGKEQGETRRDGTRRDETKGESRGEELTNSPSRPVRRSRVWRQGGEGGKLWSTNTRTSQHFQVI